ncbi:hypothetical protein [Bartonella refiksaydamii]|uniref:hypothetical protein n=1 Tax=Bartonella refiksaydamii TaxID=2654951 RepID=UPI0012EC6FAA|nr:hypothetical protein [Bartonella refiksaydamii]
MAGAIILIIPLVFFMFISIVVFAIFVNMIIVVPYYSLIKRLRLYYRVKEQRRVMKEHPQRFCCLESDEKKSKYQNLVPDTSIPHKGAIPHRGADPFSLKKLMAFSRKDYIIISVISLSIMAFKAYVYIAFFQQPSLIVDLNKERFGVLTCLILLLTFISACVLITLPVVLVLRAILTSQLKKKLQQLKEITQQQDQCIECERVQNG